MESISIGRTDIVDDDKDEGDDHDENDNGDDHDGDGNDDDHDGDDDDDKHDNDVDIDPQRAPGIIIALFIL